MKRTLATLARRMSNNWLWRIRFAVEARWLVRGWDEATDEAKANPRQFGPDTRAVTAEAFRTLNLPVPDRLAFDEEER